MFSKRSTSFHESSSFTGSDLRKYTVYEIRNNKIASSKNLEDDRRTQLIERHIRARNTIEEEEVVGQGQGQDLSNFGRQKNKEEAMKHEQAKSAMAFLHFEMHSSNKMKE